MTLANDSFNRLPDTTGTDLATHSVASKEHPVTMNAGPGGHIVGTAPTFSWWIPPGVLTSANKHFADLYNSTASTQVINVIGLWPVPVADTTIGGVVGTQVILLRTTEASSGGTANLFNSGSTSTTSHIITPLNTTDTYSTANVTARFAPTSGTPSAGVLYWARHIAVDEAIPAAYISAVTNLVLTDYNARPLTLHPGQGLLIKQGTVATTGSLGFLGHLVIY